MKNTKILGILILGIFLVGTILIAAADIETIPNNVPFSFGSWFQHTFGVQDYSIVGDSRQCSRYADETLYFYTEGDIALMNIEGSDYCSSGYALLDVFVDNWKPYKEYKNDLNSFCDSDNEKCIVEVYCCDYDECDDDNDCEDWYGTGSQCKTESANDPNIDYKYSTFKYCTEPGDIEAKCYYDTGAGTCSGTRTYIGDTICPETYMNYNLYESKSNCIDNEQPECSAGETKCEGTYYYTCSNGKWASQGQKDGECGYTSSTDTTDGDTTDTSNLNGLIYEIEYPSQVDPGEYINVEFKVKNRGASGDYLIEAGIIPKSVAKNWELSFAGDDLFSIYDIFGKFSIFDKFNQFPIECCDNQPNFVATTITNFGSGEINTVNLQRLRVPYEGIGDLCYDNTYWNGTGEYVLYVVMKTGCFPDGEGVTYETKIINIGTEDEGEYKPTESFSRNEIKSYSASSLSKGVCFSGVACPINSSCLVIENFIDSSVLSESKSEILRQDFCNAYEGDGLFSFKAFTDTIYKNTCKDITGKQDYFEAALGFCVTDDSASQSSLDEFFSWAAWFDIDGNGIKDGLDGLVIVFAMLLLSVVMIKK